MAGERETPAIDEDDQLIIRPLGAGQEVGRSCIYLQYKGRKILLDCGIHPGMNGLDALPYFDVIQNELKDIELLLISHFHLDHAGALPWFLQKTPFKGKCYMTHATKSIYKLILSDYVKVSNISADKMLYGEKDIHASMEKIETVNFHQEKEVNGIKFWCYNAGHVLGAAMFMIEIAGVKILYTGDYSREEDRHLMAAELPKVRPDVLIIESTYGTHIHEPREMREARLTSLIHEIVSRGGRCLIPVFALGRAQELLLILDEYWASHPELHEVPVYYGSSLAKKCMYIYQTYIHVMNERIQGQITISNPFTFKHISDLKSSDHFEDIGPSVVLASPGMMQSGLSRELFETWCSDKRNGVIIAGYCVEGTLAKYILSQPDEIVTMSGQKLPLNCSVEYISFSAHADYKQTSEFVRSLKPTHIVLVHGEQNEMSRLKAALIREYENSVDYSINIHNPKNGQAVQLPFRGEKLAKVVGQAAMKNFEHGDTISGIIVKDKSGYRIMDPSDLTLYTGLPACSILQKLSVPYDGNFAELHYFISKLSGDIEIISQPPHDGQRGTALKMTAFRDMTLTLEKGMVIIEWASSTLRDMFADCITAMILLIPERRSREVIPNTPQVINYEQHFRECMIGCIHDMFGKECLDSLESLDKLYMVVDNNHVVIDLKSLNVTCDDELLHQMVTTAVTNIHCACTPIIL